MHFLLYKALPFLWFPSRWDSQNRTELRLEYVPRTCITQFRIHVTNQLALRCMAVK